MQTHEIRLNYQQASQLVQVGRFEEALEILTEINDVKPNTESILYLMAMCHAKTGKKEQALELCEQLVSEFENDRAAQLKEYLTVPASPLGRSKKEVRISRQKQKEAEETPQTKTESSDKIGIVEEKDKESPEETGDAPENDESDSDSQGEHIETEDSVEEAIEQAEDKAEAPEEKAEESEQSAEKQEQASVEAVTPQEDDKEELVQQQESDQKKVASKMRRPLWLVLLWSALLASIAFCLLYIYFLDYWLNPF